MEGVRQGYGGHLVVFGGEPVLAVRRVGGWMVLGNGS